MPVTGPPDKKYYNRGLACARKPDGLIDCPDGIIGFGVATRQKYTAQLVRLRIKLRSEVAVLCPYPLLTYFERR